MFLRESLDTTVGALEEMLRDRDENSDAVRVSPDDVTFHLDAADPVLVLGEAEVPVTEHGLVALGEFLSIPAAFTKRLHKGVSGTTQNLLFSDLFTANVKKDLRVTHTDSGLTTITDWGREPIKPAALVHVASKVLGTDDAPIVRLVDETHEFGFDVVVPENYSRGNGGDRQVGDITSGGLRFGVNLKQNLAPWVQPYMHRLICTNGMETTQQGLKVDARGQTIDEVMAEIESMAQIAFGGIERDIAHFYEMRETRVDNPERAIRAMARERGIPDRSAVAIMDLAAGEDLPDDPTMFDVVNLVTNFANSPQVRNDGGRLLLERAGGAVVTDHAARCGHCHQRVEH